MNKPQYWNIKIPRPQKFLRFGKSLIMSIPLFSIMCIMVMLYLIFSTLLNTYYAVYDITIGIILRVLRDFKDTFRDMVKDCLRLIKDVWVK